MLERIKEFWISRIRHPLSAKKVRFSYNEAEVLKGITLDVKKSKIVAIVGESGSGKTTFLNLVTGVLSSHYEGDIRILGKRTFMSRRSIGYVPQEISLVPDLSIEENIKLFGAIHGIEGSLAITRGMKLLETLKLDEGLSKTPEKLSGGQKVRLNIIVSLLHNPQVLILDEPFVGLDFYNRTLLWHFFQSLKRQGRSIILTTHLLSEAEKNSDKLLILKEGKISLFGKPEDIKEKLQTNYIIEIQFHYLSKECIEEIKEYCRKKPITLLDHYEKYIMFSLKREGQKDFLLRFLDKLQLRYDVIDFRKPNMDEVFLKVRG